jgi:predicted MPP superfamily phosphohydrolase
MRGRIKPVLSAAACVVGALFLWGFWWEPSSLRVSEQCTAVKWNLEKPLRIAVLGDLHVGSPFNGLDKLNQIVEQTNAATPDLICVLGDFVVQGVVGGTYIVPELMIPTLSRLKARYGVFAVLGNHDVWLDAGRVERALEAAHIEVLEDRAVKIPIANESIWLAGISDFWTRRHNVHAALASVNDTTTPVVVLTHNPDVFPDVPDRVTLTLSAHTHGGQVRLPIIGAPIVPSKYGQRFAAGHIVENGRHLFVTTGIGTSIIPVRFRVPPTIDVLTVGASCGG